MKRVIFYICIIFILFVPVTVSASSDVVLDCLDEAMVGNEVYCDILLKPEEKIMGVLSKYEYDPVLTYYKTELSESWKVVSNSSKGFIFTNVDGISNENELAKVYFYISNDAVIGKEYQIRLKGLQLSNGNLDIDLDDKVSTVKILSVQDILTSLKVYDKQLELKDGVTSYTVTVPNEVTSVEVSAILKDEKYQFANGYAPGSYDNLKVGDNLIDLQIKKDDLVLLNYQIFVHRLAKNEEVSDEKEVISNPKTGSLVTKVVIFVFVVSLCVLVVMGVRKGKQVR